jgi:sugar (pentulose or hexulose) kinase
LSHGPGHVFRSIYEGTAFGTRHILDDLRHHGFETTRLFAGGGGVKSRLWLQIHADILGQPLHLARETETCALGSALVAAVHAGHFASLDDAVRAMVRIHDIIEPRAAVRAAYDQQYERYLASYPALAAGFCA